MADAEGGALVVCGAAVALAGCAGALVGERAGESVGARVGGGKVGVVVGTKLRSSGVRGLKLTVRSRTTMAGNTVCVGLCVGLCEGFSVGASVGDSVAGFGVGFAVVGRREGLRVGPLEGSTLGGDGQRQLPTAQSPAALGSRRRAGRRGARHAKGSMV